MNVLEDVEKSFVSQKKKKRKRKDWCHGSLCWNKKGNDNQWVDEYLWQDVILLNATLFETRAKLLLRGGMLIVVKNSVDRSRISIPTVMLGYNHAQTLAAQETQEKLVRII